MPRSILRPETGSVVWYFSDAPPTVGPFAAIVTKLVSSGTQGVFGSLTTVNLVWWDAVGVATPALGVTFYSGASRPASGAWCTYKRVNEPAAGAWPSSSEAAVEAA